MILVVDVKGSKIKLWLTGRDNKSSQTTRDLDEFIRQNDFKKYLAGFIKRKKIKAIAFRTVFGGKAFPQPVKVTDKFFEKFMCLTVSFPFYIPTMKLVIEKFYRSFSKTPQFVFFETSFFFKLPEEEKYYAISSELSRYYNLTRHGFHGLFHYSNSGLVKNKDKTVSIVFDRQTSVSALSGGRPYSISLGYTPLEGIMGNTSCGDLDPGIVFYLMKSYGMSIYRIDDILKNKSGFKGITGYDLDKTEMIKFYGKDKKVDLAFEIYKNQIIKYIGEAIAVLGGLNSIIISGAETKALMPVIMKLLKDISFLGVNLKCLPWLDTDKSSELTSSESEISVKLNSYPMFQIITDRTRKLL